MLMKLMVKTTFVELKFDNMNTPRADVLILKSELPIGVPHNGIPGIKGCVLDALRDPVT